MLAIGLLQIFEHRLLALGSPAAAAALASLSKLFWPLCSEAQRRPRRRHQQQLLPYLFFARHDGSPVIRGHRDAHLDCRYFGGFLFALDPSIFGRITNLPPERPRNSPFETSSFSLRPAGEPFRKREPPAGEALSAAGEELAETNRRLEQAQEEARRRSAWRLSASSPQVWPMRFAIPWRSLKGRPRRHPPAAVGRPAHDRGGGIYFERGESAQHHRHPLSQFRAPLRLENRPTQICPLLERALKVARERWPEARWK